MLANEKWDAAIETKIAPSLQGFISWLESKNPRKTYDFLNCKGECLMGQYMTEIGLGWTNANYLQVALKVLGGTPFNVPGDRPWTFGAALKRAREYAEVTDMSGR